MDDFGLGQYSPELQKRTNAGTPFWASEHSIPTELHPALYNPNFIAAVETPKGKVINVFQPDDYDSVEAAHEATHIFQNSRNDDFNKSMDTLLKGVSAEKRNYDYDLMGLLRTGGKEIGAYNREQQGRLVADFTRWQSVFTAIPNPTRKQLESWDRIKSAYEGKIRQLLAIPSQDQSTRGIASSVLQSMKLGALLPPTMSTAPLPNPPQAPSVALGYVNPSKLVRDVPPPPPRPFQAGDIIRSPKGNKRYRYTGVGDASDIKNWQRVDEKGAPIGPKTQQLQDLAAQHKQKYAQTWSAPGKPQIGSNDGGKTLYEVETGKRIQ